MKSYRELKVWQQSFAMVKRVYTLSSQLPQSELYGLKSQMERSAVSIPSNIAEGQQRNSNLEFSRFISIARGSAAELSTQLLLAEDIYKIDTSEILNDLEGIQKMLYGLQIKL